MKRINILDIILIVIFWAMTSACADVVLSGSTPEAPTAVIEEPTAISGPTETEVPSVTPTAAVAVVETLAPDPITTEELPTPTPTPAVVLNNCLAPAPPEGVFYLTYVVQPGDTLFLIGQKTRPAMSVDDLAIANCIADVNRIEVGQELLIWHSPTTGPEQVAVVDVTFTPSAFAFQYFEYEGPLAFGEHTFIFNGLAGQTFTIRDFETSLPKQLKTYTLIKSDENLEAGSVASTDRYYIDALTSGRQFTLPENGEYSLVVRGRAGLPLDLSLTLDEPAYPLLGKPVALELGQFDEVISVSGTTPVGVVNRYKFDAGSLQTIRLTSNDPLSALILEDSTGNQLVRVDNGSEDILLDDGGSYILTVCHCFSEGIMHGDYSFEIGLLGVITEPAPPPAEAETVIMNPVMNGWTSGQSAGTLNGDGRMALEVTLPGNTYLSISDVSDSSLFIDMFSTDGAIYIGSVHTTERHYLRSSRRGRDFFVAQAGTYRIELEGTSFAPYEIILFAGIPSPVLGDPVKLQFAEGASRTFISGETVLNSFGTAAEYDRYTFWAAAGQRVSITMEQSAIDSLTDVILEDSQLNWLEPSLEDGTFTLSADGVYTLIVVHPKGEVYGGGPYEFTLEITG